MGFWQLMMRSDVIAQHPFPSNWTCSASGSCISAKSAKKCWLFLNWIYQRVTLLCLEHALDCSGGKRGSHLLGRAEINRPARRRQGIDTSDAGLVWCCLTWKRDFFHIKILDPTCVSKLQPLLEEGKRKKKGLGNGVPCADQWGGVGWSLWQ